MYRLFIIFVSLLFLSCSSQKYFVVRHAEKASDVMTGDPPLSAKGVLQAKDLEATLHNQNIRYIFSTNYKRTISTAEPLSQLLDVKITLYAAADASTLVQQLKNIRKGNVLVVGHSNTVDDIVNGMTGSKILTDLTDTAYGQLFIIERKGRKYVFSQSRYSR